MNLINEYTDDEWANITNEFKRINNQHYLDHAGATLYSEKQLQNIHNDLSTNLYCNPHTSKSTEDLIDQVRYRILQHFNTTSESYSVIFTSGATQSLKIIGESFDFNGAGNFTYLEDNHTSVLGMREIVRTEQINCIKREDVLNSTNLRAIRKTNGTNSLFIYPAQSNFDGYKYPLKLIDQIRTTGIGKSTDRSSNWYICLDAAAFVSTNHLDLNKYQPDFLCISFYKIFGYPTGLGALLVNRRSESILQKRYYGGGTVKIAMSCTNWHRKRDRFHERFEDGTLPFLSIISVLAGFHTIERLIPPTKNLQTIHRISRHCYNLSRYLYHSLVRFKHKNNQPVIKFYHYTDFPESPTHQGSIINFNILKSNGEYIGYGEVACMATIHNIILRTGCFCNPGACQRHLKLTDHQLREHYAAGHVCGDTIDLVNGTPTGSIRISIGYMTRKEDCDSLIQMIYKCYMKDERNEKYTILRRQPINFNHHSTIRLKEICVYPIKSCGPMKINDRWQLTKTGFKYDREWMIIQSNGVALTQKQNTYLCLITPRIDEQLGVIELSHPYMECPIKLSLNQCNKKYCQQSKVCQDRILGTDCGDRIAEWLSTALNMNGLRLIRHSVDDKRSDKYQSEIALSNQAQFLLINRKSVDWLAGKVNDWSELYADDKYCLDDIVDRFRGNLIIETEKEFEERTWKFIWDRNGVRLRIEEPCTRCQMICIDQRTGEKTSEPLRTIAREFNGSIKFGVYCSQSDINSNRFIYCNEQLFVN